MLRRACELFVERIDDIARLIALENGKAGADAAGEARYAAEFFRWYAEEAVRSAGHVGLTPATGAECLQDEIFGPVAAMQTFRYEDEVVRRASDTRNGLVAYLCTKGMRRGMGLAERLESWPVSDAAALFGGVKQSGLGREGGKEGMLEFQETQCISTEWQAMRARCGATRQQKPACRSPVNSLPGAALP